MQYSLSELENKITDLPMLPAVMFELCKADPDDVDFFDDLYKLAVSDPSLAALIMSSANSASSSPNVHIHSLKAGLTRIGSKSIYSLLALASVSKVFLPSKPQHKELWMHSVQVGILTQRIYEHLYVNDNDCELAYLCGLLHDIGRLVMFQFSPDIVDVIDNTEWKTPDDLIDIESESLGYDHSSIGFIATEKMELPRIICNTIRFHHSVKALTHPKVPQRMQKILLCLQVADAISVYITRHPAWNEVPIEQLQADIITSCIKPEWKEVLPAMDKICCILSSEMEKALIQSKSLGL